MTQEQKKHIQHLFAVEDCKNCAFIKECDKLIKDTNPLEDKFISLCSALNAYNHEV